MNDKTKSNDLIINPQKSLAQEINKIKIDNKITGDLIEPEDDIKKNNKMNILASEQANPEAPKKVINYRRISFIVIIMVILLCVGIFFIIKLIYQNMKRKRYNYFVYYGKENKITAVYKGEYGQNINIINNSIYGRKISSYRINFGQRMLNLDLDYNNIRKNGKFYSRDNDTITIEIYFNSILTSLNSMFEGCEALIYANLSDLVTYRLKSMSQVFTDCKSLQKVDLTTLDTSKVTTMDNLFEGCNNLVDIIGMEKLNTASLKSAKNMFVNCENLIFADLSAFELENIKEKSRMFDNNPSLRYIDMSNSKYINFITIFNFSYFGNRNNTEKLLIKGNELVFNIFNNITWLKYIQKEDEFDISCTIGENEKCNNCSENNETLLNCETCNEGYYLPFGHMYTNTKCRKCGDNCSICEGNYYNSYCTKCKDGFYLNEYYECKLNNITQNRNEEQEEKSEKNEKEQEKTESISNEDNNQTVIDENEEKNESNNDDDKEKIKENEDEKESINDDDKEKNKENEDEKQQKEKNEEENKLNVTQSDYSIEEGNKTEKEN